MNRDESREVIRQIIHDGTVAEKRYLFAFDSSMPRRRIAVKFKAFAYGLFPRYFAVKSAQFHDLQIDDMISSYYGTNNLEAMYRGSAKTSLKKLFDVFVLLNDTEKYRKYIKVLSLDEKNSKQIVTDVYNMILEVKHIYGNVFSADDKVKHEETMKGFILRDGRKYAAGTVGQTQRGHIQDAYRPDWIWFEDIEDVKSLKSVVVTQGVIEKVDEAIQGLSRDGSYFVTCNYISDQGSVQWLMNRKSVHTRIVPLLLDPDDNHSSTWPEQFGPERIQQIKKDALDFHGEYQCDPQKSKNKFFDLARIAADIKKCRPPDRQAAGVRYWGKYEPHHRYGAGSDHSDGVGEDSNALAGFDFTTGNLVFTYANNEIGPDLSIHEFVRVCAEFGFCVLAPETNNKCGGVAITTLKQLNYPRIYRYIDETKVHAKQGEKFGWETNSKTRFNMFFEFRKDYSDGLIHIFDEDLLREMRAYTNADLNEVKGGLITRHFDLLMAAVIAWQMRKYSTTTESNYGQAYKKYIESLNG